ncbi:hypothetical protein [Hydrogenimonas urashimensis]|uniref:hypothetical protein n=1 Tax=Hydrogenimonas urashimensis TaxID=2740515 RepID=UPI001915DA75|nr:hypothetical protein [Hydrogenimonas urashimensis]
MDYKKIEELIGRIEAAESELYRELAGETKTITCDFAEEYIPLWTYIRRGNPKYALSAPIIYAMIVPALVMDASVTVYQATCFPLYGIPKVARGDYIVFDRHRLSYLNALQKLNCVYCAYFNGLIAYVREIASKTEQFWCPIRHSRRIRGPHRRYWHFLRYGDGKDLKRRWMKMRETLRDEEKQ